MSETPAGRGVERTIDVLMVTYNSPERTRLALGRLLEQADERMRVWLWHNGADAETLALVRGYASHPRVHRFHHSPENQRLWAPVNWLLTNAEGDLLSKVDDDNVVPVGWPAPLVRAHEDHARFGVLGCWRFQDEDFVPELAGPKIREFPGGHRLLLNHWVEGSCFLMKRRCRDELGPLQPGQSLPQYFIELALRGWVNGWYYPFVRYENLDDPRSPNTLIRTDADLRGRLPLSAVANRVETVAEWTEQLRRSARVSQATPIDPGYWKPWRRRLRRARWRVLGWLGRKHRW